MVIDMTLYARNISLPFQMPTQSLLREAARNIIIDLQKKTGESDGEMAEKIGVSASTIANARNRKNDIGSLTIAKIAMKYGEAAVEPYRALYGAGSHGVAASDPAPIALLALAVAELTKGDGPKARLDSLPVLIEAQAALADYVVALQRWRLAA